MTLHTISENELCSFLASSKPKQHYVYQALLVLIAGAGFSLPFIYFNISVTSSGIVRPTEERTEIKPFITGIIDTLLYREGQFVQKNAVILRIRDDNTGTKKLQTRHEIIQRQSFIHDLQILTTRPAIDHASLHILVSPLYKQQTSRFLFQQAEQLALIKKVRKELHLDSILLNDDVISSKEMFDKMVEYEKLQAAFAASKEEQLSSWQQELARYRLELNQLNVEQSLLNYELQRYEVRAPISGTLQGISTRYAGSLVQAGEAIGSLSPENGLIAECYVSPRNIGLLQIGQSVNFQVEAFDYNYFGILTGKLLTIDNDFTMMEGRPFFKVRCVFDKSQLQLRNGFSGRLKKGMTVQARFIVARRSLWQLLWDKVDDWLNPVAPKAA